MNKSKQKILKNNHNFQLLMDYGITSTINKIGEKKNIPLEILIYANDSSRIDFFL